MVENGEEPQDWFESLVVEVLDNLPHDFLVFLEDVSVVIEEWPSRAQLYKMGLGPGQTLLGLYEGVPRTVRTSGYSLVPPDKITIFRGPILANSFDQVSLKALVRRVVLHEIAHHFGISDERLHDLGAY